MIETGQTYRSVLTVTDENGAPANPSAATYTITRPDQTTTTSPVTLPPAVMGKLIADYVTTMPGLHAGKWATTSPGVPKTDYFHVGSYRSVLSLDEGRDYLNQTDTRRDELIRAMLMGATEEAEKIVGTLVPKVITAEWVNGQYKDVIQVAEGPLLSKTSVTSITSVWNGGPSWALADLIVNAEAGTLRARDMLGFWWGPWEIASYTGGRMVIPEMIRLGVQEILWDLWTSQRGATADETYPSATEAETYTWQVPAGYHPPPRAKALLSPYERPGFG